MWNFGKNKMNGLIYCYMDSFYLMKNIIDMEEILVFLF